MPNFPVPVSPIRISQALTQPALLQNVGTETIYLDSESSVSQASYGLGLVPRSTVNWPANKELWAMVPSGIGNLSVLFNAEGPGLAEVAITGDITIGSPVIVQGGGVILYDDTITNIPANSFTEITINGPIDGTTFYGLDVSWEMLTSGTGITVSGVSVFTNGVGLPVRCNAIRDTNSSGNELAEMGFPEAVSFTAPMKTTFPLTVRVHNSHASAVCSGHLRIVGSSYALPYPVDNMNSYTGVGSLGETLTNPAAGDYVTLPASYSTLVYRMQIQVAGADQVNLKQWNTTSSAFDTMMLRLSRSPYYSGGGVVNDIQEFSTPPIGLPHQLVFGQALAGTVRVYLAEILR